MLWDPFPYVRRAVTTAFRTGRFNPEEMISFLVHEAVLAGAGDVAVALQDDWWVVSSTQDWLPGETAGERIEAFHKIVPYPGGGPYSMRAEIYLTEFATDVVTASPDGYLLLKGVEDPALLPFVEARRGGGRMVAFRVATPAGEAQSSAR